MWDDLRRYDDQHQGDRMGVNDIIYFYPEALQHGVSLHTDYLPAITYSQFYRAAHIGWPPLTTHSHQPGSHVKHVWPLTRDGGTSGLFGILIGLLMGYEKIILAGMPCDDSPHFWEPPWKKTPFYLGELVQEEFIRARDAVFNGRVKSLSGRTREWLGEP